MHEVNRQPINMLSLWTRSKPNVLPQAHGERRSAPATILKLSWNILLRLWPAGTNRLWLASSLQVRGGPVKDFEHARQSQLVPVKQKKQNQR